VLVRFNGVRVLIASTPEYPESIRASLQSVAPSFKSGH
jgi:hypothetical protein